MKKKKKLKIFKIIGLIFIIVGFTMILNTLSHKNQQIFQINSNVLLKSELSDKDLSELKSIIVTQNIPIPKEIQLKREEEKQEKLRKEAEEKARLEVEKRKIEKEKKVTSRGGTIKVTGTKAEYQNYVKQKCNEYGWSDYDFECLVKIVNKESNWNVTAKNKSSGAYGLFQSLPASKMASEGSDYLTNYKTQINWGIKYIKNRYGTPANAWAFWQKHKWY